MKGERRGRPFNLFQGGSNLRIANIRLVVYIYFVMDWKLNANNNLSKCLSLMVMQQDYIYSWYNKNKILGNTTLIHKILLIVWLLMNTEIFQFICIWTWVKRPYNKMSWAKLRWMSKLTLIDFSTPRSSYRMRIDCGIAVRMYCDFVLWSNLDVSLTVLLNV